MSDNQKFWSFMAVSGIFVLFLFFVVSAQLRFSPVPDVEQDYMCVYFGNSIPVNFVAWSFDSSNLELQGTVGYNAIFLVARGEEKNVNGIFGAGVGSIVGYGKRPVLGITAVILISQFNIFFGYDFLGRNPVIGAGYTVVFPFPPKACVIIWKKEVKK